MIKAIVVFYKDPDIRNIIIASAAIVIASWLLAQILASILGKN
jgi:hypothetical protein